MGSENDDVEESIRSPFTFDTDAYLDAADRLERSIDIQIQVLEGIDDKAEHLTRLIALLIGLIFSVISLVTQLGQPRFEPPPTEILATFAIGVAALLASLGTAIITYLSSRYRIGLHQDVGAVLSDDAFDTEMPEHVRNVLGTYAFVIGQNRETIVANIRWFRTTLIFLLVGMLFVSLSGFLYVGGLQQSVNTTATVGAGLVSAIFAVLIWTGKFYRPETKIESRTMAEEDGEKKSVSESKAVVKTESGTRYRSLSSGKSGESESNE